MNEIVIYTDGGCSGNPGPGGWGVVVIADGGIQKQGQSCHKNEDQRDVEQLSFHMRQDSPFF